MRADHGYSVVGNAMIVTRSDRNLVYELDGTPVWKLLTQKAGIEEDIDPKTPGASALWGIAMELPQDLYSAYGGHHAMHLGGPVMLPDGAIPMGEICPEGTRIWLAQRNEDDIFRGTDRIVKEIVEESGGRTPAAVFHADCAIRGKYMFNRFLKEEIVARMQHPLSNGGDVPWLGFYDGGEYCRIGTKNRFHVYSAALFAFYRKTA
jgi:hypothetical protein